MTNATFFVGGIDLNEIQYTDLVLGSIPIITMKTYNKLLSCSLWRRFLKYVSSFILFPLKFLKKKHNFSEKV